MRAIQKIIIHCAATPNGKNFTVDDIDYWHRQRDFHRKNPQGNPQLTSIGYHFVIYVDGSLHTGRHISEIGAHAVGFNNLSIGICMIGTDRFSDAQWVELKNLVEELKADFPDAEVLGHRDLPGVKKTCPGFDVKTWMMRTGIEQGEQHHGSDRLV